MLNDNINLNVGPPSALATERQGYVQVSLYRTNFDHPPLNTDWSNLINVINKRPKEFWLMNAETKCSKIC